MAKTSMVERNKKRRALVKKYASRRTALKKQATDENLPPAQACRAAAQRFEDADQEPLRAFGPPARLLPQAVHVAHSAAGASLAGAHPRHGEIELVRVKR